MQSDIVLSRALRSKECEHSAKHVLYEAIMHLEKNIFILTSDGTQENGAVNTT